MTHSRSLVAGLCAIVLLTVLPLTLVGGRGASKSRIVELLHLANLQSHLQVEVLRLREGLSRNYDNVMQTSWELRSRIGLAEELRMSPHRTDRELAESLSRLPRRFRNLDEAVTRFATCNSSVLNSLAMIPGQVSQLDRRGPEYFDRQKWPRAEVEELSRRVLSLHAAWNSVEARALLERHTLARSQRPPSDEELKILLNNLALAVEQSLRVELILNEINSLCSELDINRVISDHVQSVHRYEHESRRSTLLIQGTSFGLALLIGIALCISAALQSERLRREIREHREASEQAQAYEVQLRHAQKLESVGQLAAGIAHEINTPTQYVGDNTRFLGESFDELAPLLKMARELANAVPENSPGNELAQQLCTALDDAETEYLVEEIPRAITQSLAGIDRVRKIVQSMKEFSHPGREGMSKVDLNRAIESTVTVASNEWKYVAELSMDFDSELPMVSALPGEFNQVILNLIVNASHAIADVVGDGGDEKGLITITTRAVGELAEVRVTDTGGGIPKEARDKIFDPFFTTKEVGKGTGQGLSIAHAVIVQRHGGSLEFETELGQGTTFIVRIPIEARCADVAAA